MRWSGIGRTGTGLWTFRSDEGFLASTPELPVFAEAVMRR